ncbi:MAG: hypothetical protein OJF49_003922 [Ktedonobacterales bacterium]|nr:MAG: hypothetical protein OJF49_003922 [Ktedonobacterales bacterium]
MPRQAAHTVSQSHQPVEVRWQGTYLHRTMSGIRTRVVVEAWLRASALALA